jgi:hypothetical protein
LPYTAKRSQPEDPESRASAGIEPDEGVHESGCPNTRGQFLMSQSTGAIVPARCARLGCWYCVIVQARRRSLAISYSRPERAVLLTDVGGTWPEIAPRMKRIRYDIAEATGRPFEWVWHVEPNPSGDGRHHVHAWSHGAFVPQKMLARIADRRGVGGVAFINRIRSAVGASQYGLKGLGYGLKSVTEQNHVRSAAYLVANGRRLTHQSRGYWRDAEGARLGARAAEDLALGSTRERDPGPWTLITV